MRTIQRASGIFFLFTSLTLLFYIGIVWFQNEYEKKHRYDEPEGAALKVAVSLDELDVHWLERLLLFYLDGE
ncbi:DUF4227 family protein [Bacillus sp. REN10]|uniref:DUF4227 family protein n=1 Tax=Bacillus sp. REN10 TaxID=2782541 RepID=UPI00193C224A|nr:DUF4227 family protein [Bacillus sp. REN10]